MLRSSAQLDWPDLAAIKLRPRLQGLALPCLFILFGFLMGSWAGRIPALRDGLHIPHAALSMVLVCGGLGAVVSYPITSRLMAHLGGRQTLLASGLGLLTVLIAIGSASTVPTLMVAVLMLGITASCFDVAVNAAATERETRTGKSGLSVLHAWFCAGSLAGAGLGSVMAGHAVAPQAHFSLLAVPGALLLVLAQSWLREGRKVATTPKKSFALPKGPMAMLGMIGFLGAMAEGSIADWSGVFLKDHFGASDAFSPLALSVFSSLMLLSRMGGDRIKSRFGARRPLCLGATIAAAGLMFAVLAPNAHSALAGFALAGCGLAFVFPFVFSAAGRRGTTELAGIATMTYTGSLMGPPIMGALAQGFGIQASIATVGLLALGIAGLASRNEQLDVR